MHFVVVCEQSPVKEMIQVQGFGSEKVLQLLYGERMRCHLLDSKWRSGWGRPGRPSPPPSVLPSPPWPWSYNCCICIVTIFFPTCFPKQCVMIMNFWQCLKFRDVFSQTGFDMFWSRHKCHGCVWKCGIPQNHNLTWGRWMGKWHPPKKKNQHGVA